MKFITSLLRFSTNLLRVNTNLFWVNTNVMWINTSLIQVTMRLLQVNASNANQDRTIIHQTQANTSIFRPTVCATTTMQPKLPKLILSNFNGEVTKWSTFWDSNESAIHNNDAITCKVDKFNYLCYFFTRRTCSARYSRIDAQERKLWCRGNP